MVQNAFRKAGPFVPFDPPADASEMVFGGVCDAVAADEHCMNASFSVKL